MCDELKEINCKISRYDCKLDNVSKKIKELEKTANKLKKKKNENISIEQISEIESQYHKYKTEQDEIINYLDKCIENRNSKIKIIKKYNKRTIEDLNLKCSSPSQFKTNESICIIC